GAGRKNCGEIVIDSATAPAYIGGALSMARAGRFPPRPMRSPAQVAELVDAHGSGPCAARRGGSSPLLGTILRGFDVHRRLEKSRKSKEFQKITSGGVFWCLLASRKLVGVFVGIKITVPNTDRHMEADKFSD